VQVAVILSQLYLGGCARCMLCRTALPGAMQDSTAMGAMGAMGAMQDGTAMGAMGAMGAMQDGTTMGAMGAMGARPPTSSKPLHHFWCVLRRHGVSLHSRNPFQKGQTKTQRRLRGCCVLSCPYLAVVNPPVAAVRGAGILPTLVKLLEQSQNRRLQVRGCCACAVCACHCCACAVCACSCYACAVCVCRCCACAVCVCSCCVDAICARARQRTTT